LRVKIAELELRSFEGLFSGRVKSLEGRLQAAERDLQRVQSQQARGQASQSELDQAQVRLTEVQSELEQLKKYEYEKQMLRTRGELEVSKRNLVQLERDAELQLSEAEAAKNLADRALEVEQARRKALAEKLAKCKAYAPADGVVLLHGPVREGVLAREHQWILTLLPRTAGERPAQTRPPRVIKNVLAIPKTAVVQRGSRDWCLVLSDQGIEQRPIAIGDGEESNVEVHRGLTAGDRVLLYPDQVLPPGPSPPPPGQ
jgi:multidrug efflux pump subunit AcrA (membrane-fusion protein)